MGKSSDKSSTEKAVKKPVKRLNMAEMQKMSDETEKRRAAAKGKPKRKRPLTSIEVAERASRNS